jgi:hypothetical protein
VDGHRCNQSAFLWRLVRASSRTCHDSRDLVKAVYRTYEHLPAEIQADLPLKRVWMLVPEDTDE